MTYQKIEKYLKNLANPEIASHSQRFFKTAEGEYGFGDKFLGIRVPVIRKAVKKFKTTPVSVAKKLLKSEYHEIRLFALLLLVFHFSKSGSKIGLGTRSKASHVSNDKSIIKQQEEIYQIYLCNTHYINNWDLIDSSAQHIVGVYLENRDRSVLYELSKSESLWERRIAIMSTFHFIKINQFDDTMQLAKQLLCDKEDLIHKAVGWMLREVGKRDISILNSFLKAHYLKMPRTMLRYAIEKFSKEERQKYLKGKV